MTEIPATPQTGAGIATLIGVQGVALGNVDLFAPNGIIDAGEAGIRVSGNLTVAALEILHVQNIQVQGHAVGLPTIVGPNVASAIAASNTAGGTNSAAEEAVKQQTSVSEQEVVPSLITVQVLGYGGGE
jgi:filamentous hemagglutinin